MKKTTSYIIISIITFLLCSTQIYASDSNSNIASASEYATVSNSSTSLSYDTDTSTSISDDKNTSTSINDDTSESKNNNELTYKNPNFEEQKPTENSTSTLLIDEDDLSSIDTIVNKNYDLGFEFSTSELFTKLVKGEIDFSFDSFVNGISKYFFEIFSDYTTLLYILIILCIGNAFLQNLTKSFKSEGASKIAFYISYILLVSQIILVTNTIVGYVDEYLNNFSMIIDSIMPLYTTILIATFHSVSSEALSMILVFLSDVIFHFYSEVMLQLIKLLSIISVINLISEYGILTEFVNRAHKILSIIIKYTTIAFISIVGLVGIGSPVSDDLVVKSSKAVLSFVPVVGSTIGGALESVNVLGSISSKIVVFIVVIVIGTMLLAVMLKIIAVNIVFYIASIVAGIVNASFFSQALNKSTKYFDLMISIVFSSTLMFLVSTCVLLFIV